MDKSWIKTVDQLPDTEQEVSVYFKNSAGWHVTTAFWDGDGFIEMCERCGHKSLFPPTVTHWQPLPEPPLS